MTARSGCGTVASKRSQATAQWVARSGLERVARIAAALTDANGSVGSWDQLESLMLLKIAHLKRERPPGSPDCRRGHRQSRSAYRTAPPKRASGRRLQA